MSYMVLWMDHDHAKIFNFKSESPEISHLSNKHHVNHHNTGHVEHEKLEQQKKFYHELSEKIAPAERLLLVGPGLAKNEFKNYLLSHHAQGVAKSIVGTEAMDKISDGEIQALAKKFFHKYNLFN